MKKIKCERCGAKMEFDGDDAYVCPDCGMFATVDPGGNIYFNDDELSYDAVGEQRQCDNCGTFMVLTEDGWECPECGEFIPE